MVVKTATYDWPVHWICVVTRLGKVVVKDKLQREGIPAYFKLATGAVAHSNQSEPTQV